jgi:hypothetical protein
VTLWWSTEVRLRNGIFSKDGAVQIKFLKDVIFGVIIKTIRYLLFIVKVVVITHMNTAVLAY